MERFEIYEDIKTRSKGDIYVGVVGPVRCGKSLFISKFMKSLVIPNIKDMQSKQIAIDELPQSAEGRTIMTTQPKFVPATAAAINVDNINLNVRLVDCVGYLTAGAMGHEEDDKPRLVKTPWQEEEMPFEEAAEIGTKKVIEEHSTFGVVMTTDGTVTDLPRSSYVEAEERVINELKETKKPFVVVVNSSNPKGEGCKELTKNIAQKFDAPVIACDVSKLDNTDIENIFEKVLGEFEIKSFKVKIPPYLKALDYESEIIQNIVKEVCSFGENISKLNELDKTQAVFLDSEDFEPLTIGNVNMGEGDVCFEVKAKESLFYKILSNQCGKKIANDFELVALIKDLAYAKREFDKIEKAMEEVENGGYGIVTPNIEDLNLEKPQIVKQGSKYGVKMKATAPTLHIMKVDVETEISPLVGSEEQCKDLVTYLNGEFENNEDGIWNTNMFGKTLHDYVKDGMDHKVKAMPIEAQKKMRRTLTRIVNEGKGGIICILL